MGSKGRGAGVKERDLCEPSDAREGRPAYYIYAAAALLWCFASQRALLKSLPQPPLRTSHLSEEAASTIFVGVGGTEGTEVASDAFAGERPVSLFLRGVTTTWPTEAAAPFRFVAGMAGGARGDARRMRHDQHLLAVSCFAIKLRVYLLVAC